MGETFCFGREMGIDRRDFFRILPRALGGLKYREKDENHVTVAPLLDNRGSLSIRLGEESSRQLSGLLKLPVMQVDFSFSEISRAEVDRFMQRFDMYYRRGGG